MSVYPGNILTATAAGVSAAPASTRTWAWLRNGTAIPAQTAESYLVTEADVGALLAAQQIETNFLGTASAVSASAGPVVAYNPSTLFALNEPGVWLDPSDVANLNWRRNLLTWTEQFDNAVWSKNNITIPVNVASAPNGTVTADRLSASTTGTFRYTAQSIGLTAQAYTFSCYLKYDGTAQWVWLLGETSGDTFFWFDIQNGAIGGSGGSTGSPIAGQTYNHSIQSAGDGWYRCVINFTKTSTTALDEIGVGVCSANNSANANAGQTTLIWGAQLEAGSTASAYQPITDLNSEVIALFPNATLYQDTAGTTPVTTPGQPVGLALDKSKGLVRSAEMISNGTFDSATNWTLSSGVTIAGGICTFSGVTHDTGLIQNSTAIGGGTGFIAGRTYEVEFTISNYTSGQIYLVWPFATSAFTPTNRTYRFIGVATDSRFSLRSFLSSVSLNIDNISVKELPGNHATQGTAGSRPIYGINPFGGRRNLLTYTEDFSNAAWVLSQLGAAALPTRTLGAGTSPAGVTACRLAFSLSGGTATTDISSLYQTATVPSGPGVFSVWLRSFDGTSSYVMQLVDPTGAAQSITVTGSWQRFQVTATSGGGGINYALRLRGGQTPTNSNTADVLFSQPQVEAGSTATNYQRVTDQYDVTEAGVPSVSYLQFDTSKFLVTPTITPGTDKAQVFAGVRALSATANQTIYATDPLNSVAGSFGLRVNTATALQPLLYGSLLSSSTPTIPSIPVTLVTTQLADIGAASGSENGLRVNGGSTVFATNNAGTGNLSAQPIYIGQYLGSSSPFNGQIYSLIVRFGATLPADDIAPTETWVAGKTGISIANNLSPTIFARDETAVLDRFNQTIERRAV